MRATEFVIFFSFLMAPPLLLGFAVLALLRQRIACTSSLVKLSAAMLVLSMAVAFAFVAVGPSWLARAIGVRDTQVLGLSVSWAPFAFLAVGAAVLIVLGFFGRSRE